MIHIDGSLGEGGGQVLRTSLTLAALTAQAVRITDIRAGRSKPGLRAQHLQAVKAAAAISGARVTGAAMGATTLAFEPNDIRSGNFEFHIGTAGATTLVLQTIFLPLLQAPGVSTVRITGGTHVPWSPCYHYLDRHWLPYVRLIGCQAQLALERAGFYPRGGGSLMATVHPGDLQNPLDLTMRGRLRRVFGLSLVARLDRRIAERQRQQASKRLKHLAPVEIEIVTLHGPSPGTCLFLLAEFEHTRACYFALGKRGKPAERVADEAVDALRSFLDTDGAIDPYLADQLLLPLALAGGESRLRPAAITDHLLTNAAVIRALLPVSIAVEGEKGAPGLVMIQPMS